MGHTQNKPFMHEAARILSDKFGAGAVDHCLHRMHEAADAGDFVGVRNWVELTLTVVQIVPKESRRGRQVMARGATRRPRLGEA